MNSRLVWTPEAQQQYAALRASAETALKSREASNRGKASRHEGLFKQVHKCLQFLTANPRHPGLQTHAFHSIPHPYNKGEKVFEAYAQHRTPGAYRVFWCYGPQKGELTIIAITPHP